MRAAIADFLYQYKLMVQYPDDFHGYLEPMAADTLDVALLPIVDAFYDDFGAFQVAMQEQIYDLLQSRGVSYSASGLVSIKMLAGTQGKVDSKSQNDFKTLQGASAADIATAIASIQTDPATAAADLLKDLSPTPVTTSIGKELAVTTTVHSLSGAYGMELELDVQSTENGASVLVKGATPSTTDGDLNSRVTNHTLTTKVRVNSHKLFEVSTARSLVVRGQAPWVPIDPLFEIPVLSLLVKHPLKPKAVYTQSLIFVDALVVPTAIDLGYGTPFVEDAYQKSTGGWTPAKYYLKDMGGEDLKETLDAYHDGIVKRFTTEYLKQDGTVAPDTNAPIPSFPLQTIAVPAPAPTKPGSAPVPTPK